MTAGAPWLDEVLPAVAASGVLQDPRLQPLHEPWALSLEGTATVAEVPLVLSVDVHPDHPMVLPLVRVRDVDVVGHLPHVADDGTVCYHETTGLSSSVWRPVDVVIDAVGTAVKTLERGLRGNNRADFVTEAEWYWLRQGAWLTASSVLRPSPHVKTIHVTVVGTLPVLLTDSVGLQPATHPALASVTDQPGLFVPLDEGVRHAGLDVRSMVDMGSLRAILHRHTSPDNQRMLAARLKKHPTLRWLVIAVPRSSHDHALLGIDIGRVERPHVLSRQARVNGTCRPFSVRRLDREHLMERGGAAVSLTDKKIAVVGCGAVGGHVASALARTGVGELFLVDPEVLDVANVFRHALGWSYVGQPKAHALAAVLGLEVPHLVVHGAQHRIQDVLRNEPTRLDRYDAIVNAIGDVTLTRWLNRELHPRTSARVVHTWLEPLGLGGHALLTTRDGAAGCYECLFVGADGDEVLHARSDLAASGQTFHTSHAACGGTYTSYADLDARRTAELATRMVVDTLRGGSSDAYLRTWKSDGATFLAAGFRTSPRFALGGPELTVDGAVLAAARCRVCGESR